MKLRLSIGFFARSLSLAALFALFAAPAAKAEPGCSVATDGTRLQGQALADSVTAWRVARAEEVLKRASEVDPDKGADYHSILRLGMMILAVDCVAPKRIADLKPHPVTGFDDMPDVQKGTVARFQPFLSKDTTVAVSDVIRAAEMTAATVVFIFDIGRGSTP